VGYNFVADIMGLSLFT